MGLPGSGKTYLSKKLASLLKAVHFNADEVRATINRDLGFSKNDRIENAFRLGWMCQFVSNSGYIAIADFVCPLNETRSAFNADFTIWLDTIQVSRYEDTNNIFIRPANPNLIISDWNYDVTNIVSIILNVKQTQLI
jgi:adenylylsulfate kinase